MRKIQIVTAGALLVLLSGCSSLPNFFVSGQNEGIDEQVKSDVTEARTALVSLLTANPTATGFSEDELKSAGYDPANTTLDTTVYLISTTSFCVDATSRTGVGFKASRSGDATEGFCESGVDY
jgi:hypothetical protein